MVFSQKNKGFFGTIMRKRTLLNLYHILPYGIKSIIANLYGFHLKNVRYGANLHQLVECSREKEYWELKKVKKWQAAYLANHLSYCVENIPYYRDYWAERKHKESPLALENWPILDKKTIQSEPEKFLPDRKKRSRIYATYTSGSTGTPLKIFWDKTAVRKWYALFELRWRNWYGINLHDRWAIFGGQLVVPSQKVRPPFWVFNYPMNQLYCSTYHLRPQTALDYRNALTKFKVQYLYGYSSSLSSLAQFLKDQRLAPPKLKVIITNAEPLYQHQRELIESVFRCPVRETYGMAEMVAGASQCEIGNMHIWPEAGVWEVQNDDGQIRPYGEGKLVATGFLNKSMPLIRYCVGDQVVLAEHRVKCPCGRSMQRLESIEGRMDDLIKTKDGRLIGRLDPVFKSDIPIREAQIIQESMQLVTVKLQPGPGFGADSEESLRKALVQRIGPFEIRIEKVQAIPRGANGKFKSVISKVKNEFTVLQK